MIYLKIFNNEEEKTAWLNGSEYAAPNVALTKGVVEYNLFSHGYATLPLYVEAIDESIYINFENDYEYSRDNSTWISGNKDTSISAEVGEKVYFRATGLTIDSRYGIGSFNISSGKCKVGGNIMSMAFGADFKGKYAILNGHQFTCLFMACAAIVDASELVLPATTLTDGCYSSLFQNCSYLENAPKLPAKTLAKGCYIGMYSGCTRLKSAPELPAMTLAEECYYSMFRNCTSLVAAPELPATTLAEQCYQEMFPGCINIETAPVLPALTLTKWCYESMFFGCAKLNYIKMLATDISAIYCMDRWVDGVAASGTFVKNAAATWDVVGTSGIPGNWTIEYAES